MRIRRKIVVLCVEDNPADQALIQGFFEERSHPAILQFANDGMHALDYLLRRGAHADAVSPDLILLDLNLPKVKGTEILKTVKNDERLRHIPVVVFTSSSSEEDIALCYELHANSYFIKPVDLDAFQLALGKIESFWLDGAELVLL